MGSMLQLTATDGHKLGAYRADPAGKPRGGLVVIQEIFGVNHHIRGVADGFAADGYACVAPALFDRVQPGIELGYSEADIAKGRDIRQKVSWDNAIADIRAALGALSGVGKIGIVGYCWGGTLTWVSATRIPGFAAASSYYGGGIGNFAEEKPGCPVQMHFGEKDHAIPMSEVDKVRTAQNGRPVEIFVYPNAGHGFNCDERGSSEPESAKQARTRTLDLFRKNVG
jgi:carboxymethylenebutenolidase